MSPSSGSLDRDTFQNQVASHIGVLEKVARTAQETLRIGIPSIGWIQTDQWTRTGNFTFTLPYDATLVLGKGVKVRYTLPGGASYEYGVVLSSSYVPSTCTVTLITNTDFAMTATPDLMWFANIENPIGWPDWFNYAPSYDASGAMTFTGVAQDFAKYKVNAQTVTVIVRATGTTGGVAGTQVRATLPTNALLSALGPPGFGNLVNAAAEISLCTIVAGPPDKLAFIRSGAAVWGLGAGRIINGQANYQMA